MDKNITPAISVVMSIYNGAEYVRKAIDSILGQTFTDFEFIIVNDGSTDKTADILASYKDSRITVIAQNNQGLVSSLNRAIKKAKAPFIARQDADDYSQPTRLAEQLLYLHANPDTVIVGTSMQVMNNAGSIVHQHHVLLNDPELKQELLVRSPFAHGSVVFRKDAAIKAGLYKKDFWPAEDYEFWLRLSKYGKFANIDEPLYVYRENSQGISQSNQTLQHQKLNRIQALAWQRKDNLVGRKIKVSSYKKLADGHVRIERLIGNRQFITNKAMRHKQWAFGLRVLAATLLTPQTYRKRAGKIVRKARRHAS